MKYKLKTALGFPAYEDKEPISKGTIFEVFMVKELKDKVIVYCKTEKENWRMYLETLKTFAEEYYEPRRLTICARCKRFEKCKQSTMKTRTWLNSGLGTCAIFEEKE